MTPPLWGCWKNTGQGICLQTYAQVCGIAKDVPLCVLSEPFPNSHSLHHSQIVRRWQYFLRPERRSLGKAQEGRRHTAVTTSGEGKHLVQKSLFPPTPGTKKKLQRGLGFQFRAIIIMVTGRSTMTLARETT